MTLVNQDIDIEVEVDTTAGPRGYSAYDIAVQEGYEGTETEWLLTLKGDKGDTGEQGETGEPGAKGDTGATGKSIEYKWDGTKLGIRQEGQTDYEYSDLKGAKGDNYTITSADYNAIANITKGMITVPTKLSELTNDSGFITNAVSDLVYYYTKAEVNDLVDKIPKFNILVVDELPTEDISTTTIYLLRNTEETGSNIFTEYIYVNSSWEKLGSQTIDLSDYATKEYVDNKIGDINTVLATLTTPEGE